MLVKQGIGRVEGYLVNFAIEVRSFGLKLRHLRPELDTLAHIQRGFVIFKAISCI